MLKKFIFYLYWNLYAKEFYILINEKLYAKENNLKNMILVKIYTIKNDYRI